MSWFYSVITSTKKTLKKLVPFLSPYDSARGYISEQLAKRIHAEASARAYQLLAQSHRSVLVTVVWQNLLLLASLGPVYFLHSPWPFYGAYAIVAGSSIYNLFTAWPSLRLLAQTKSVTQTLSHNVLDAIRLELTQLQLYERKVVEWLGPDLKTIADEVAKKLRGDVIAMCLNLMGTLVLSFIAFRLFAIPLLEQRALLGHF